MVFIPLITLPTTTQFTPSAVCFTLSTEKEVHQPLLIVALLAGVGTKTQLQRIN